MRSLRTALYLVLKPGSSQEKCAQARLSIHVSALRKWIHLQKGFEPAPPYSHRVNAVGLRHVQVWVCSTFQHEDTQDGDAQQAGPALWKGGSGVCNTQGNTCAMCTEKARALWGSPVAVVKTAIEENVFKRIVLFI